MASQLQAPQPHQSGTVHGPVPLASLPPGARDSRGGSVHQEHSVDSSHPWGPPAASWMRVRWGARDLRTDKSGRLGIFGSVKQRAAKSTVPFADSDSNLDFSLTSPRE